MPNKLAAKDKRSHMVLVSLRPIEHAALRKRAAQHGSTMSSTLRLIALRELFQEANRTIRERKPVQVDADWPEAAGR